jgi:hypothetical protein
MSFASKEIVDGYKVNTILEFMVPNLSRPRGCRFFSAFPVKVQALLSALAPLLLANGLNLSLIPFLLGTFPIQLSTRIHIGCTKRLATSSSDPLSHRGPPVISTGFCVAQLEKNTRK